MKKIFDKKFLYLEWDDSLKGKKVIVDDLLQSICRDVNGGAIKLRCVEDNLGSNNDLYPFRDEFGTEWALVYYDPNYECKIAYVQGRTIQFRNKGDANWIDTNNPNWIDRCEYRVKPEKTYRPFKDIQELKYAWEVKWDHLAHHELVEPMIWVRDKERPDITRLITDFNAGSNSVALACQWHILEALFEQYEFLDGAPIGVACDE